MGPHLPASLLPAGPSIIEYLQSPTYSGHPREEYHSHMEAMTHQHSPTTTCPDPSYTSSQHQDGCNTVKSNQASLKGFLKLSRLKPKARKYHLKLPGPIKNHATASSSNSNSLLLRLTAEIRCLIFSCALTSPTSSLTYNATSMRFDLSNIGTGLLTSCHEVAIETQYLHLKLNTLIFDVDGEGGLNSRDLNTVLRNLKRLEEAFGWFINVKIRHKAGDKQHRRLCDRKQTP